MLFKNIRNFLLYFIYNTIVITSLGSCAPNEKSIIPNSVQFKSNNLFLYILSEKDKQNLDVVKFILTSNENNTQITLLNDKLDYNKLYGFSLEDNIYTANLFLSSKTGNIHAKIIFDNDSFKRFNTNHYIYCYQFFDKNNDSCDDMTAEVFCPSLTLNREVNKVIEIIIEKSSHECRDRLSTSLSFLLLKDLKKEMLKIRVNTY